jgi:hypothetical protein
LEAKLLQGDTVLPSSLMSTLDICEGSCVQRESDRIISEDIGWVDDSTYSDDNEFSRSFFSNAKWMGRKKQLQNMNVKVKPVKTGLLSYLLSV